jgi:cytochrome b561/polyisoprenoid-binding protein YceI
MRRNSPTTYGSVAKSFHWLIAALVITMIALGIYASGLADANGAKPILFSIHKTMGLFIFFLALARIAWALSQPKPGSLHPQRKVETFLAALVHWLLYASLIVVPLSGWVHHAATTGFAPIWWPFGQGLPFVPVDDGVAHMAKALHIIFERVLAVSILLHVAGALKHHFIDHDDTLRRMLPGHSEPRLTASPVQSRLAPAVALGVYAAALGIGGGMGLFAQDRVAIAELDAPTSEWQVQEGTLGIVVKQLGSEVTGRFADWTAAITFAETPDAEGKFGDVAVTVAIGSLTLGSVTAQAMGPDFLDAESSPTATFTADILASDDGYIAQGILRIRDQETPVTLPFALEIDGDTAMMDGFATVDRMAFNIGAGTQPTEGSLGFDVGITVALRATR